MRTNHLSSLVVVVAGLASFSLLAPAQDASVAQAAQPAVTDHSVPQLSSATSQILQLAQADVGDETIIAYVKTTGNSYRLDPGQIIYLRQQGVSAAVLTTMLNQPKSEFDADTPATTTTPPPASPADGPSAPGGSEDSVAGANQDPTAVANAAPEANGHAEVACVFYPDPLAPDCTGSRVTVIYYESAPGSACGYQPRYTSGLRGWSAVSPAIGFGGRWGGGWQGGRRDGFHTSGSIHGGRHR